MADIKLVPLAPDDREQFITDNQERILKKIPTSNSPDGIFRFEKIIK